jgi:hypothetical protein
MKRVFFSNVSDRILLIELGLEENPIRNVVKKNQSETSPTIVPFNEEN